MVAVHVGNWLKKPASMSSGLVSVWWKYGAVGISTS